MDLLFFFGANYSSLNRFCSREIAASGAYVNKKETFLTKPSYHLQTSAAAHFVLESCFYCRKWSCDWKRKYPTSCAGARTSKKANGRHQTYLVRRLVPNSNENEKVVCLVLKKTGSSPRALFIIVFPTHSITIVSLYTVKSFRTNSKEKITEKHSPVIFPSVLIYSKNFRGHSDNIKSKRRRRFTNKPHKSTMSVVLKRFIFSFLWNLELLTKEVRSLSRELSCRTAYGTWTLLIL